MADDGHELMPEELQALNQAAGETARSQEEREQRPEVGEIIEALKKLAEEHGWTNERLMEYVQVALRRMQREAAE